jgi:hypothetical protein
MLKAPGNILMLSKYNAGQESDFTEPYLNGKTTNRRLILFETDNLSKIF